jgi:hypothetical protein
VKLGLGRRHKNDWRMIQQAEELVTKEKVIWPGERLMLNI